MKSPTKYCPSTKKLGTPDKGLPLDACYDLQAQTPQPHYAELLARVRNELLDIGMPLDQAYGAWYAEKMRARRGSLHQL